MGHRLLNKLRLGWSEEKLCDLGPAKTLPKSLKNRAFRAKAPKPSYLVFYTRAATTYTQVKEVQSNAKGNSAFGHQKVRFAHQFLADVASEPTGSSASAAPTKGSFM